MKKIVSTILLLLLLSQSKLLAQACSLPGMTPSSAIPVCGTSIFSQALVTDCTGPDIAIRGCTIAVTSSKSFWYKFTCFQSGTLGFLITGRSNTDDYDWSLLDVTGRNPNEVFTNTTLQLSLNVYGTSGNGSGAPFPNSPTGCSPTGTGDVHCEGDAAGNSPFNRMPPIIAGHEYLLMVTNWTTGSTQGYDLSFSGGTASITDPLEPHIKAATAACDGTQIRIKVNKRMKCKSLATNGSDFTISTATTNIIAASGYGCSNGFDMDSVLLTLNNPLAPGNYTITIGNGSDGNTLLDNCDRLVPTGENIPLTVFPFIPTPMDSLTKIGCAPTTLQLVFRKPMFCNSIAADGSDFVVTGPAGVTVIGATGTCVNGLSSSIAVQLSAALQLGGMYTIRLKIGTDGNTIIDECGQFTPAGATILFTVSDTVNADFNYNILYGCQRNTVQYTHSGLNGVNSWLWNFDNSSSSALQNPLINYIDFRQKNTTLIVSNGVCKDTAAISLFFDNLLNAVFEASSLVCPGDKATIKNNSEGNITSWDWTFGNGLNSTLQNPATQIYTTTANTRDEIIQLIVRNSYGCADTAKQKIKVINNCYIAVPSAFTPNNDGLNDFLYPLNAYKAKDLSFSVYNRFGQRLFFTRDWTNKWDGSFKGQGADPGTYVWILSYIHTDTNLRVEQKGTSILIR